MANAKKIENRSLGGSLRAESQGDEMALVGYAALFNSESKDLGGFREVIAPGAFTRTLKAGGDVKALVNHSPDQVLGRTKNGTLQLEQDDRGLKFRVQLNPKSQAHRDTFASVKRGDLDSCSFAFTCPDGGDDFSDATDENGLRYVRRTLRDINLLDASIVCYPAYDQTSVSARMLGAPDYSEKRTRTDAERKAHAQRTLDQIARDEWAAGLLNNIMAAPTEEKGLLSEADMELQRRMQSASGRTVR